MNRELPSTHNWAEVNIHHALLRVIAMASGRIFVGPELCRSEKYIDSAINYTVDVMSTHSAVHGLRSWLRPILAPRLPQVQALQRRVHEATEFMKPIVERRKRIAADPNAEKPDDMLQWMINDMHKFPDKHSQNLARVQLSLSFAAIHTTTVTATNVFVLSCSWTLLFPCRSLLTQFAHTGSMISLQCQSSYLSSARKFKRHWLPTAVNSLATPCNP